MSDNQFNLHNNSKNFLAAIEHTAYVTGFQTELIEKDYYCSLLLNYLSHKLDGLLVFKGGTLLAKAHAGFYRLSEDLDFTVPISINAKRKERSTKAKPVKAIINTIPDYFPEFNLKSELKGSNESTQYNAELNYQSLFSDQYARILIEIGLRETLLCSPVKINLHSVLMNPFTNKSMIAPIIFQSLSREEAYAEKIRAALTRDRLAIRDYYDIYYALQNNLIDLSDEQLIEYINKKIKASNDIIVEFDEGIQTQLERKIESELIPTLSVKQAHSFDLTKILIQLQNLSKKLSACYD